MTIEFESMLNSPSYNPPSYTYTQKFDLFKMMFIRYIKYMEGIINLVKKSIHISLTLLYYSSWGKGRQFIAGYQHNKIKRTTTLYKQVGTRVGTKNERKL